MFPRKQSGLFRVIRAVLLLGGALVAGHSAADVTAFLAIPLTGSQQVPSIDTTGYGTVSALYNSSSHSLAYTIAWRLQPGATATAAHFHGPAVAGANAAPIVALANFPAANSGWLTGAADLSADQEVQLLSGGWYFNIHSTMASNGELRGQLVDNAAAVLTPVYTSGSSTLAVPAVLAPGLGVFSLGMGYSGNDQFLLSRLADITHPVVVSATASDSFDPGSISVSPGQAVQWQNTASIVHSVTADSTNSVSGGPNSDPLFPSGLAANGIYSWSVPADAAPGTVWYYHCRFHGSAGDGSHQGAGMAGTIRVQ